MRRLAVTLQLLAAASCAVDLPPPQGLACDDGHPCLEPHVCVDGRCVDPAGEGGGSAAGGGAAGGGSAGGGAAGGGSAGGGSASSGGGGSSSSGGGGSSSSGGGGASGSGGGASSGGGSAGGGVQGTPPLWGQKIHGFSGQSVYTGCALEIDATRNNKVVSTIRSALDSSDRATANQFDAGFLPKTGAGRLRGRFQLPSTLKLNNNSSWLVLVSGGVPQLALSFNGNGDLVCRTEAGMVGPQAITQSVTWAGGFLPNVDYLVDVTWQQGHYRRLAINGTQMLEALVTQDAGMGPKFDQLRLGIYRYDGTSDAGWTVSLTDWQLSDDPTANLTD